MLKKIKGYTISNFFHQKHKFHLKYSKKIIIGSCFTYQKGWYATDYPEIDITSIKQCSKYWRKNSKSAFVAEHVWEHLDKDEAIKGAKCCYFFLKRNGRLRIAVPDGNHPDPDYIDHVKPNGIGLGSRDHKFLYTIDNLTQIFRDAGFRVRPLEFWDKRGKFHSVKWNSKWGNISRSLENEKRNTKENPFSYTSIIIDCYKGEKIE